jgi:hypothetical protein
VSTIAAIISSTVEPKAVFASHDRARNDKVIAIGTSVTRNNAMSFEFPKMPPPRPATR